VEGISNGPMSSGFGDIFDMFTGGMGGGGGKKGPKKGKSVQHQVKATLEDLYNGKIAKVAVNRERICSKFSGKGGKEGAVRTCTGCKGKGIKVTM